jgi:uncharacterized protein (DUF924 family)
MTPADILDFWFSALKPAQWFKASSALDDLIRAKFSAAHLAASRCETYSWRDTAAGRLAEIIVLDQFSRNIHRGTPLAFATDPLALTHAQTAVALGADLEVPVDQRAFLYMPYMHSESPLIHGEAVRLFSAPGLEKSLSSEQKHKAIIDRFGRFPHRNAILGRPSTPEELAFLEGPGSSF